MEKPPSNLLPGDKLRFRGVQVVARIPKGVRLTPKFSLSAGALPPTSQSEQKMRPANVFQYKPIWSWQGPLLWQLLRDRAWGAPRNFSRVVVRVRGHVSKRSHFQSRRHRNIGWWSTVPLTGTQQCASPRCCHGDHVPHTGRCRCAYWGKVSWEQRGLSVPAERA